MEAVTNGAGPSAAIGRRLKVSGTLLILGLVVEAASQYWHSPLAFIAFVGLGATLVALGVLLFLWTIVSSQ